MLVVIEAISLHFHISLAWQVHVRRRCGLLSNYFNHFFTSDASRWQFTTQLAVFYWAITVYLRFVGRAVFQLAHPPPAGAGQHITNDRGA